MAADREEQRLSFEFGVYTFGDLTRDPHSGRAVSAKQRLEEIIAAARLAEEAGLDVFGVGEHHTPNFAVTAPPVVLAAVARHTKRIKLTSATTVLSTVDPVRLYEDFATLDLLSDGRAEIIAGRGAMAFLDTYRLFGYGLTDYDALFEEKINLLLQINHEESVSWKGRFRPELLEAGVAPRPLGGKLPLWIGVGRTPESAERAGRLGAGLAFAQLSGDPSRLKPLADAYRAAGKAAGYRPEQLPVAVCGHGYIAPTSRQALDEYYPYHANYFEHIMQKRNPADRMSREEFERSTGAAYALAVGGPEQIVEKIMYQHELIGHSRYILQLDIGGVPYAKVARSIELLAKEVMPVVRRELRGQRRLY
ncbi:LLM class flavin-dependent oxidoreductase [Paenibacillus pinisoli]|uniref:LLM class flavin-dependent oxidoreductase n=1 Tax=Paenibacillus pinisoli TaxID=1276110 RepID=A0A3A6PJA6_9BACL|nr:LLM class flavin-dependent oxidoreductase [Paenibacillus pinisoli]RJX40410.1 LLM class flavin-dependent oxidoreductase [Paenibacillus pinisoli]